METLDSLTLANAYIFAELEVGEHFLWKIGNFSVHGQVFLVSWIVIALLLIASLAATITPIEFLVASKTLWNTL